MELPGAVGVGGAAFALELVELPGEPGVARTKWFSRSRSSVINCMEYRFPGMAAAPPRNLKLQPA